MSRREQPPMAWTLSAFADEAAKKLLSEVGAEFE